MAVDSPPTSGLPEELDERISPAVAHLWRDERDFLESVIHIRPKAAGPTIPWRFNKVQRYLWDYHQANPGRNAIALKARQQGVTTFYVGLLFARALLQEGRRCVITAHVWDTAHKIKAEMIDTFLASIPPEFQPIPDTANQNKLRFPKWGSSIEVKVVTRAMGRGGTITDLHRSERAYEKSDAVGLTDSVPLGGWKSSESTGDDPDGVFRKACEAAHDGRSNEDLLFSPWWWSEDYAIERDEDIGELTEDEQYDREHGATDANLWWMRMKRMESDYIDDPIRLKHEFPSKWTDCFAYGGAPYFHPLMLDRVETGMKRRAIVPIKRATKGWVIFARPEKGETYGAGADVAEGVERASSAAHIGNARTGRVVARFQSDQIEPYDLARELAVMGRHFNLARIGVERNNHGHAVLLALKRLFKYPNLYRYVQYDSQGQPVVQDTPIEPGVLGWPTGDVTRPILFSDLHRALDVGMIELDDEATLTCLRRWQRRKGKIESSDFGDLTISLGVMWQVISSMRKTAEPPSPTMIAAVSTFAGVQREVF